MQKYKSLFVVLSLLFVAFALYQYDYLQLPAFHHRWALGVSLVILVAAFCLNAFQWKVILDQKGLPIRTVDSFISFGLAVFGKYMPGKIWVHLGKGMFIAERYGYSVGRLSEISVFAQIISIWAGGLLGAIGYFWLKGADTVFGALLLGMALLSVFIFTPYLQRFGERLIKLMLKKEVTITAFNLRELVRVVPVYTATILLFTVSFYFLLVAVSAAPPNWIGMFSFPVGLTFGVLMIFLPGGIGARESAIVWFLMLTSMPLQEATGISLVSRLWFFVGEVLIFLVAVGLRRASSQAVSKRDASPEAEGMIPLSEKAIDAAKG